MFCIIVIAGPEKADDKRVNRVKHTIEIQKFPCIVAIAISGTEAALPIIGMRALIHGVFFSYLSARIPPIIPDASPTNDKMTELTKEY